MKVKVGNKIYDGEEEPIMVILEDYDRENIQNMPEGFKKYTNFPDDDSMDEDEMRAWMKEEGEEDV